MIRLIKSIQVRIGALPIIPGHRWIFSTWLTIPIVIIGTITPGMLIIIVHAITGQVGLTTVIVLMVIVVPIIEKLAVIVGVIAMPAIPVTRCRQAPAVRNQRRGVAVQDLPDHLPVVKCPGPRPVKVVISRPWFWLKASTG